MLLTIAATCLVSLLLAIIAVLPAFHEPRNAPRNPFFFGHFARRSETDFLEEMATILESDATLYEAAVSEIYSMGVYLFKKKYRFLRLAYLALLIGFILATVVGVWTFAR